MEADLLAAIAAAPDDMAPRLVYADYLIANGDERGELIVFDDALRRDHFQRFVDDAALRRLMDLAAKHGFPRFSTDPPDTLDPTAYVIEPHFFGVHVLHVATNTAFRYPNRVEAGLVDPRTQIRAREQEVLSWIASRAARLGRAFDTIDVPYREAILDLVQQGPPVTPPHPLFGVIDPERWCGLWKRWFRRP